MFRTLLLSALLLASTAPTAQTPVILAQDAENLVINDRGDIAYLSNLTLWSEKGFSFEPRTQIVTQLGGLAGIPSIPLAQITEYGPFGIDLRGDVFAAFELQNNLDPSLSAGFFRATDLALINGDPSVFPPLSPGSVWLSFQDFVKVNRNGRVLLAGQVQDPAIPGFGDDVLLSMDFDASGLPSAVLVHGYEGALLPDQVSPIRSLPDSPVEAEINGNGDVLWGVRFISRPRAIYLNDQPVLQEGDPASVPGLTIASLTSAPLDLNDAGDWLVLASLTPAPSSTNGALIKNGEVIVREGDPLGSSGFVVEQLPTFSPLALTDAGESLYVATLSPAIGPGTGPNAIVLDDEILAQAGKTRVQGLLLESLYQGQQSPAASPNGRYVTYRATLELGADVVVLLDLGRTKPLTGCAPNEGVLARDRGFPVAGGTMDLRLDNAQSLLAGANSYLLFSSSPAPGFPSCGTTTPWGELLINFGTNGDPFFVQQATSNPQPLFFSQSPALVNQTFYVQGIFFDPGASPPFRYTNALEVEIGA